MPRFVAAAAAIALVFTPAASPSSRTDCARPTGADLARLRIEWPAFRRALVTTFRSSWIDAAVVSFGESRWNPAAVNGQHLGYFQLGTYERGRTGWTADAAGQVRAASAWNAMTGGRWAAWSCRP